MAESTSVSPPAVYYKYSAKAERASGGYRLSAHVYANSREELIEQLGLTLLEAEKKLESLKLPVDKKVKE